MKSLKFTTILLNSFILFHGQTLFGQNTSTKTKTIPTIPKHISYDKTPLYLDTATGPKRTTVVPEIQYNLAKYIKGRGNPVAGVVVVEVATGNILAMVDGRSPDKWGAHTHTVLHEYFPAASLFKTIVASAAVEIAGLDPQAPIGVIGGCGKVRPTGGWMTRKLRKTKYSMNLRKAYGHSCNGFFAKIAVNNIGMGPILEMASRFRWGQKIPADFNIPVSPMAPPTPERSSVHTIGKFAAGFGYVGTSAMHAAWRTLAIANDGLAIPLKLFAATQDTKNLESRIITKDTAMELRKMMVTTIRGGTATSAFRKRPYRRFRWKIGGKTGTLSGNSPEGVTTWFTGVYPLKDPEIVVASVAVIKDLWIFKAPTLAAEAVHQWRKTKKMRLARGKQLSKKTRPN